MSRMEDPSETGEYTLAWKTGMDQIGKDVWDALALSAESPFLEWDWLYLLERTGCVSKQTGWMPLHLTLWRGVDLAGAAPIYVRTDSDGEFVFDHIWQEAARQLGIEYYPKLLGMSPFTPMPGYRFLLAPGHEKESLTKSMLYAVDRLCQRAGFSGAHFHFVDAEWSASVRRAGYGVWQHQGFIWENPGYRDFEDFLSRFTSRQRKTIRRERKAMRDSGVSFSLYSGEEIPNAYMDLMYDFYLQTNRQYGPWACLHLNRAFFRELPERCPSRLLLVCAYQEGEEDPVAMALLVHKGPKLYGRYWGCRKEIPYLHFNTCFYQPMEWAIRNGLRSFDPGIGGAHKHRRGFRPVSQYSVHYFFNPLLQQVFQTYVPELNRMARQRIQSIGGEMPWRQGEGDSRQDTGDR